MSSKTSKNMGKMNKTKNTNKTTKKNKLSDKPTKLTENMTNYVNAKKGSMKEKIKGLDFELFNRPKTDDEKMKGDYSFITIEQGIFGMTDVNELKDLTDGLKNKFLTDDKYRKLSLKQTVPTDPLSEIPNIMKFILFTLSMNIDRFVPYNENEIPFTKTSNLVIDLDFWSLYANNIWEGPVSGMRNAYIFIVLNKGVKTTEDHRSYLASAVTGIICTTCTYSYTTHEGRMENVIGCMCGRFQRVLNFITEYELPRKCYAYFNHNWTVNPKQLFADGGVDVREVILRQAGVVHNRDFFYKISTPQYDLLKECINYCMNGVYDQKTLDLVPDIDMLKSSLTVDQLKYVESYCVLGLSHESKKMRLPDYVCYDMQALENYTIYPENMVVTVPYKVIVSILPSELIRFFSLLYCIIDDYMSKAADVLNLTGEYSHNPFFWMIVTRGLWVINSTSDYVLNLYFRKGFSPLSGSTASYEKHFAHAREKKRRDSVTDMCLPLPTEFDKWLREAKSPPEKRGIRKFINKTPTTPSELYAITLLGSATETLLLSFENKISCIKCKYTKPSPNVFREDLLDNDKIIEDSKMFKSKYVNKSWYKEYVKKIEDIIMSEIRDARNTNKEKDLEDSSPEEEEEEEDEEDAQDAEDTIEPVEKSNKSRKRVEKNKGKEKNNKTAQPKRKNKTANMPRSKIRRDKVSPKKDKKKIIYSVSDSEDEQQEKETAPEGNPEPPGDEENETDISLIAYTDHLSTPYKPSQNKKANASKVDSEKPSKKTSSSGSLHTTPNFVSISSQDKENEDDNREGDNEKVEEELYCKPRESDTIFNSSFKKRNPSKTNPREYFESIVAKVPVVLHLEDKCYRSLQIKREIEIQDNSTRKPTTSDIVYFISIHKFAHTRRASAKRDTINIDESSLCNFYYYENTNPKLLIDFLKGDTHGVDYGECDQFSDLMKQLFTYKDSNWINLANYFPTPKDLNFTERNTARKKPSLFPNRSRTNVTENNGDIGNDTFLGTTNNFRIPPDVSPLPSVRKQGGPANLFHQIMGAVDVSFIPHSDHDTTDFEALLVNDDPINPKVVSSSEQQPVHNNDNDVTRIVSFSEQYPPSTKISWDEYYILRIKVLDSDDMHFKKRLCDSVLNTLDQKTSESDSAELPDHIVML